MTTDATSCSSQVQAALLGAAAGSQGQGNLAVDNGNLIIDPDPAGITMGGWMHDGRGAGRSLTGVGERPSLSRP